MESTPATVTVEALYSTRRKRDTLPVHPDLVNKLREWFREKAVPSLRIDRADSWRDGRLWPGRWAAQRHGAAMLREDLEKAEIPYADEADQVFDFHALRHQFISTLAKHGVHPNTA